VGENNTYTLVAVNRGYVLVLQWRLKRLFAKRNDAVVYHVAGVIYIVLGQRLVATFPLINELFAYSYTVLYVYMILIMDYLQYMYCGVNGRQTISEHVICIYTNSDDADVQQVHVFVLVSNYSHTMSFEVQNYL
jgi:hypothetical protein